LVINGLAPLTYPACPTPATTGKSRTFTITATALTPGALFTLPSASDGESGVQGYLWHIGVQPETTYTASGWTAVPTPPSLSIAGTPLDYQGQFYLSVVATNFAGTATRALTYGPFQVVDPTAPTGPQYCEALAGTLDRLNVQFSSWSQDPETGVLGYRYRVRTAAGTVVRDWRTSGVDWLPPTIKTLSDDVRATNPLNLVNGQRYYVDVRAVNARGMLSDVVASGPLLYDITPPPTPSTTVSYALGRFGSAPRLTFQVSAPNDPESGLAAMEFAVGTTQGGSDLIGWTALPGFTVGSFSTYVTAPPLSRGTTFWVQLRTRNGVGTWSAAYQISVRVP